MSNIELLEPGYLGISQGEFSLNVVCIDQDGDPCFFPVTQATAKAIDDWALGHGELPDGLTADLVDLLEDGAPPAIHFELEEDQIDIQFGHLVGEIH